MRSKALKLGKMDACRNMSLLRTYLILSFLVGCAHVDPREQSAQETTEALTCTSCKCEPTKPLLELLSLLQITHDGSLASIVSSTQSAWLRASTQERWHIVDRFEDLKPQIAPLLEKMGLMNARHAKHRSYEYAVVFGATYGSVQKRLAFLAHEWQRGVLFNEIIFLGSERPLTAVERESVNAHTETEMMKLVYAELELPKGLRDLPATFVDSPMKRNKDGSLARPNTGDTIIQWLKSKPIPCRILAVSNQPYVSYQHAVMKTIMPKDFIVETVGIAAGDVSVSTHLDNLARLLYQEQAQCTQSS